MATHSSVTPNTLFLSFLLTTLLLTTTSTTNAETAITCGQVTTLLGIVPPGCCSGLAQLDTAEKTTEDLRTACRCVVDGAAGIPGLNYDRVNELPGLCNTACPYKVYPDTDCSK
ncbi:Non-specific lipid-transfer protein [Linum perenne]